MALTKKGRSFIPFKMLQKKLSVKSTRNNGHYSLTDDTGIFFIRFFKICLKRPILIYFFQKWKKKIFKILDKEFYDGKNWSWLNAFLFLVLIDKRMDPFQCWVFRIFNQIYWMIKSSHRPCTLMKVDNRLTLVHFLHKSLEKILMYDTALFLCPQQWRGKIFQLSHSFLFNYSLWHSILASLSSF